jgi:hypothetical protein
VPDAGLGVTTLQLINVLFLVEDSTKGTTVHHIVTVLPRPASGIPAAAVVDEARISPLKPITRAPNS